MTTDGERLARVQSDAHARIDAIYQPLSVAVGATVERALRGRNVVTNDDRLAIVREVDRLIDAQEGDLYNVVSGSLIGAQNAAEFGRAPIKPDIDFLRETAASRVQIIESLETARVAVVQQTDKLLVRAIALGWTAAQTARAARQYFAPFYATRRDVTGNLVRVRDGAVRSWPARAGMASAHIRMTMLTETNAMHFRAISRVASREGRLLRYHVSHKHVEIDECDRLERQDVGFGTGLYPPRSAPKVPRHPRCRCWYEPADRPRFLARSESVPA